MTYSLSLRPRALTVVEAARDEYALVGHGESFLDELDSVFEVIQAMPLRFPIVCGEIHRALLRRYPWARARAGVKRHGLLGHRVVRYFRRHSSTSHA